jgi:hypothetical protein
MTLSVIFLFIGVLSVTHVIASAGLPDGINPFWKLSFIFKCLTDTVILDDFKTALDRMKDYRLRRLPPSYADRYGHAERASTEPITVHTTVTQREHFERNFDHVGLNAKNWVNGHVEHVELQEVTPPSSTICTQIR